MIVSAYLRFIVVLILLLVTFSCHFLFWLTITIICVISRSIIILKYYKEENKESF